MNKVMNKLLLQQVQFDLGSGLFIALVIGIISTFMNAGGYLAGICVAAVNYFVSGYVISTCLVQNKKQFFITAIYFLRLGFIVITIIPIAKSMNLMMFYVAGFITHYILLVVLGIKNRKGSV